MRECALAFPGVERTTLLGGAQVCQPVSRFALNPEATLAATFAKKSSRAITLAVFREAFAGGTDLSHPDNILTAPQRCVLQERGGLGNRGAPHSAASRGGRYRAARRAVMGS